jgi:hypothetical protein
MTHTQDPDITEHWEHPVPLSPETDLYKLLEATDKENSRINLDIESLYDNRFIETATGEELEKIGELVGVRRKNAEGDEKLRKRITAEFIAQASDTTYRTFAIATLAILETNPRAIDIEKPPDSVDKVVNLYVDGGALADNPLTNTEIASLLDRTVSAGGKVNIIEQGTFAFDGDESTLEGFNEGTWSSIIGQ